MTRRPETLRRVRARIDDLTSNFETYLRHFDENRPFSAAAWSLHRQTIDVARGNSSVTELAENARFVNLVYETVSAWGMNSRGAKLLHQTAYSARIRAEASSLSQLEKLHIERVSAAEMTGVTSKVWMVLSGVRATSTKSFVVAASKTIHHFLPDLVPPIDRKFTYTFFGYPKELVANRQKRAFEFIYPYFREIAIASYDTITKHTGRDVHTSVTKTIDNAIIGYGLAHERTIA